jgi:hypothetical protein
MVAKSARLTDFKTVRCGQAVDSQVAFRHRARFGTNSARESIMVVRHGAVTFGSRPSGGPKQAWREAAAHQRVGRRAKKNGACVGKPRLEGLEVER